ncbi:MAG: hypothetical protein H6Q10_2563, partial [Acidobacteria bacterium]|nr:hypothetical protein [Acidobacteriota bacterium]
GEQADRKLRNALTSLEQGQGQA